MFIRQMEETYVTLILSNLLLKYCRSTRIGIPLSCSNINYFNNLNYHVIAHIF